RIGRKPIMLTGCLLAVVSYIPIYHAMTALSGQTHFPATEPAADPNVVGLSLLVLVQGLFVPMVYGAIAGFLVGLFPARLRYTSMSLPYHIGNGVFGGLVPFIGTAIVAKT